MEVTVTPNYLTVVEGVHNNVELCAGIDSSELITDETVVISLNFEDPSYFVAGREFN